MNLPDVNVLVYAFRSGTPHHAASRAWLDSAISSGAPFGMSRLVLSAVVRLLTNPRIFSPAESAADVFGFCDHLLARANAVVIEPGPRHWAIFSELCQGSASLGPRVTDAWLAALALEHSCTWITFDRDFARFAGLSWRTP